MIHTVTVALPPAEVLARAKAFFAERVPQAAAFPGKARASSCCAGRAGKRWC